MEPTGDRWIPLTKASDASFGVLFDLRLDKRLSKQYRRHYNDLWLTYVSYIQMTVCSSM